MLGIHSSRIHHQAISFSCRDVYDGHVVCVYKVGLVAELPLAQSEEVLCLHWIVRLVEARRIALQSANVPVETGLSAGEVFATIEQWRLRRRYSTIKEAESMSSQCL